jgi:hypothetical protein
MLDDDKVSGQVIEPYKGSSVGTSFLLYIAVLIVNTIRLASMKKPILYATLPIQNMIMSYQK